MADSPDMSRDAALARAACAGDSDAYAALVDTHLASVYRLTLRMVSNASDAEDLAQDAFLRAFERLHLFDASRSFRAWLLKIAANLAINHLRARRRHRTIRLSEVLAEMPQTEPYAQKADMPRAEQWQQWLDKLTELQRSAIVLFHFCEMSYVEVGSVLDMPVNTVKTHIHRGRKRLRQMIMSSESTESGPWSVAIQNG
jgi:RNA polymerase sigma-70 factor (ECF subfamily)